MKRTFCLPLLVSAVLPLVAAACVLVAACDVTAHEIKTVHLWPDGAPGAKGGDEDFQPTLTIYPAPRDKNTGAAIVICPGGGYGHTAMDHEGHQIGAWLNEMGISGFIVDYRHRRRGYGHPAPLQDAQRAIRTVRAKAADFRVDPKRIGILGFSAGGHLASTAGTHFDRGNPDAKDPVERASCRPDFMVLCYAVIAFDEPYTHRGSQHNLIGKDAPAELVRSLSNEKQVTKETPPTFLWTTNEDRGVPAENSVVFYLALRKAGVPAELHSFHTGRHGLGLAGDTPGAKAWPMLCEEWLREQGLLEKK